MNHLFLKFNRYTMYTSETQATLNVEVPHVQKFSVLLFMVCINQTKFQVRGQS
jgi:hypothetical protein